MPLFTFKCKVCSETIEKFVKDNTTVTCKCGSVDLEKQIGFMSKGKIWKSAKDYFEDVIQPEVNRIQQDIESGKDNTISDLCGD